MQFFPIEFPPARVALRLTGKPFELRRVLMRVGLARELLEIVPHQLINTGAQRFRMSPGLTNHLIVDGKSYIHKIILRAHVIRVKPPLLPAPAPLLFSPASAETAAPRICTMPPPAQSTA